jgi:bacteriocin-like protein
MEGLHVSNMIEKLVDADRERALLDATPNAATVLSDDELSKVSGGRVKTSDRQQKAVLDFVKG